MSINIDYYDEGYSILTVNDKGKLRRLYTPFRVLCIVPVEDILPNTQVYVDEIRWNDEGKLFYVIFKKPISHQYFYILMKF